MTKNNYSHIKSFNDFRDEKMRLYYEIRLSEKKLEIKKLELKEYINPIRFISSVFQEFAKPLFDFLQSLLKRFFVKEKNEHVDINKNPEKPSEKKDD